MKTDHEFQQTIKCVMDIVLSFLIFLFSLPLFAIIGTFIKLESQGPVIFKQKRPGHKQKIFTLHKFRTMKDLKDKSGNLFPDVQRLTKIGQFLRKSSLDELPELFNVIKGEMSLVGPRPLLVQYLSRYSPEQARRHEVKPGITGWAQVNGRNAITWEDKFKLDVWYVDNRSLWLDLKIIAKTVFIVLKRTGISQEGEATMREFKGANKKL